MSSRLVLCRVPAGGLVSTLPPERDLAAWHEALTAELASGLGPAHAAILAAPENSGGGLEWITTGTRAVAAATLPAASRQALLTALGSILADIGALAASGQAPLLAAAWPSLRLLPDDSFVYAVDGRPVLAAWGHAPAAAADWPDPLAAIIPARLSALTPRETPIPAPGLNNRLIGACLAAALLFGLLLPGLALWPFTCAAPAATTLAQDNAAIAQNAQASAQLAQLDEQAAQQKAQCGAAAPKAALPQNAWDSGKLGMLSGCWKLVTNIVQENVVTNAPMPISSWRICFDNLGKGVQTVTYGSGDSCQGPVQASFTGDHQMQIAEPQECSGPSGPVLGHWLCTRSSDSQADCTRTDHYGTSEGVFQR